MPSNKIIKCVNYILYAILEAFVPKTSNIQYFEKYYETYLGTQIGYFMKSHHLNRNSQIFLFTKNSKKKINFNKIDLLECFQQIYLIPVQKSLRHMITFLICLSHKFFDFQKRLKMLSINSLFTFTLSYHKNLSKSKNINKFTLISTFTVLFCRFVCLNNFSI